MPIQVQELPCQSGVIGVLTLDSPATLNALTEAMIDDMQATLDRWEQDPQICLVLLDANGDRGFCAGGNILALYQAISTGDQDTPQRFFSKEYRLMYQLHRFAKPVVGWAHRVVMGGGMGLLSACRYRLVTPDLMMAMPEISIGLFPDVGASWFLNRLPAGLGLFLGLTGARLNAADALRVGLADFAVQPGHKASLLDQIQSQSWTGNVAGDDNRLHRLLNRLEGPKHAEMPASNLANHERRIAYLCRQGELPEIVDRLLNEPDGDAWWQSAIANLREGCPVTAWLVNEQLQRAQQMSLKDVLAMELAMALTCCRRPDLPEGIRARLVDRDQAPRWSHPTVREVEQEVVAAHFTAPWPEGECPLQLD
ncbi:MAG: enoyl-CoA hydratase/isomerase family protein [Marinobacter sp.]|uniref:enoyl-CoA hydratase/isomerase family protein n=1 Tax=Marinobacter sp. TaxID=50741 RepID=UPI00299F47BC|nr:enoyl-CoA hydratase/isomerase family protein [Marinobacter sp.]MDX1757935.1 enoyl-CoA hydratase/isomerase family protein [Marinobacter sp.]